MKLDILLLKKEGGEICDICGEDKGNRGYITSPKGHVIKRCIEEY